MNGFIQPVLITLVLACVGCSKGPTVQWQCGFYEDSGHAVLDSEGVTLIFEGVPITVPAGKVGGGSTGSLQISGGSTTTITLAALDQTITNSYADGVNTISIADYSARIKDSGKTLEIGDKVFALDGKKVTIIIHPDGTAEIGPS
jgi:hypothetical protein